MPTWFTWKRFFIALFLIIILSGGALAFFAKDHKQEFALGSLSVVSKVSKFLPLEADTKKELEAVNQLAEALPLALEAPDIGRGRGDHHQLVPVALVFEYPR